jgi:hypothetical protein
MGPVQPSYPAQLVCSRAFEPSHRVAAAKAPEAGVCNGAVVKTSASDEAPRWTVPRRAHGAAGKRATLGVGFAAGQPLINRRARRHTCGVPRGASPSTGRPRGARSAQDRDKRQPQPLSEYKGAAT